MHIAKSSFAFWNFLEFFPKYSLIWGWLNPQVWNLQIWMETILVSMRHPLLLTLVAPTIIIILVNSFTIFPIAHTKTMGPLLIFLSFSHSMSNLSGNPLGSIFKTYPESNHFSIPPLLPPDLTHHHHFPGLLNKPHIATLFPLCTYSLFSS